MRERQFRHAATKGGGGGGGGGGAGGRRGGSRNNFLGLEKEKKNWPINTTYKQAFFFEVFFSFPGGARQVHTLLLLILFSSPPPPIFPSPPPPQLQPGASSFGWISRVCDDRRLLALHGCQDRREKSCAWWCHRSQFYFSTESRWEIGGKISENSRINLAVLYVQQFRRCTSMTTCT